jgi:hypothetical protein
MANTTEALVILTHAEYVRLKQDLQEAGLDLCYTAQAGQPVRLDWSAHLFQDAKFLQQLEERRPEDPAYRIASVRYLKKGGWFRPDAFGVSFHTTGDRQQDELAHYLAEHQIRSSREAPKAMLGSL